MGLVGRLLKQCLGEATHLNTALMEQWSKSLEKNSTSIYIHVNEFVHVSQVARYSV